MSQIENKFTNDHSSIAKAYAVKQLENFDSSIFSTHYFKESWLQSQHLDNLEFEQKLEYLFQKDLKKDKDAEKMENLLIFNVYSRETWLMKISDFKSMDDSFKLELFQKFHDFYIPRSLWYRSLKALYEL